MNEDVPKRMTEADLSRELKADPKTIDFDDLLTRAYGVYDSVPRIYFHVGYVLRHLPNGNNAWKQALNEFFASHNPDSGLETQMSWCVRRTNALLNHPLKLKERGK